MSRAIWIGGPKHGNLIEVPDKEFSAVQYQVMAVPRSYLEAVQSPVYPDFKTVTCQVRNLPLAPGRRITYVHHPEITEETARMYIADLVIGEWNKYVADSRNRY